MRRNGFGCQTDVFSLGVIILGMITKRISIDFYVEKHPIRPVKTCKGQCLIELDLPKDENIANVVSRMTLIHPSCRMKIHEIKSSQIFQIVNWSDYED